MVSPTRFEIPAKQTLDLTAFLECPPCRAYRPTPPLFGPSVRITDTRSRPFGPRTRYDYAREAERTKGTGSGRTLKRSSQ